MVSELKRWLMEFSSTYVESDVLLTKIQQTVNSLDTSSSTNLRVVLEGGLNDLRGGDEEGCLRWSGVAEEWAWEQLHTGHWKDTSIACRELYSLASLLRGLAFAKMGEHEKSLEVIDKGILMGAPVLGHTLQEMATILTTHISGSKEKEDCLTAMVTNAGADQPEVSGDGKELAVKDDKSDQSLQAQKDVTGKVMLKKRVRFRSFVEYDSDTTEPPCKRLKEASPSPDREGMEDPRIDSDHQIKVLTNPSISAFQDVMDSAKPVILCKCMEHWPAMGTRRWSLEYIRKMAGPRTVPVELGSSYTKNDWSQKLMTVSQLIDEHILNEKKGDARKGYLAQHHLFDQVPELRKDICIPDFCCLTSSEPPSTKEDDPGDDDEDIEEQGIGSPLSVRINAWFGPGGTVSPLHHDPDHNLLTQVIGRKYIKLFPSDQTPYLYPHEGILSNTSQVDIESPDYHQFPLFRQASWMECILKPGEMLYIPPKCWHYVRSLDISFSVSFWWR